MMSAETDMIIIQIRTENMAALFEACALHSKDLSVRDGAHDEVRICAAGEFGPDHLALMAVGRWG